LLLNRAFAPDNASTDVDSLVVRLEF